MERPELAAQLGTDRPTGSRDQHTSVGHVTGDRIQVDVGWVATEQIGDRQRADVVSADRVEHLADPGEHEDLQPRLQQWFGQLAQAVARDRRDRHQHGGGAVPLCHVEGVVARAAHPDPTDPGPGLAGVVVEERHRPVPAVGRPQQRARDLGAGLAGPDHEQRFGRVAVDEELVLLDQAGGIASDRGDHEREEGGEHRHRARHEAALPDLGRHEQHATDDRHRGAEHPDLVEAAVVVAAAIETDRSTCHPLQHDGDTDHDQHPDLVDRSDTEVVAQQRRDRDRDRPCEGVQLRTGSVGTRGGVRRRSSPSWTVSRRVR